MIERIPEKADRALLYFHSAGTDSREFLPFIDIVESSLENTYVWAGDGNISGSPLMYDNGQFGESGERFWFMFPMQDASSEKSFHRSREAMGASLLSAGAFVNSLVDQIKERYGLSTEKIVLSGFQHGSALALAAAMMRRSDPFRQVILFEPYLLEAFYLEEERIARDTTVLCVDNEHIRERTFAWLGKHTDREFSRMGMDVRRITTEKGDDHLSMEMIEKAVGELGK